MFRVPVAVGLAPGVNVTAPRAFTPFDTITAGTNLPEVTLIRNAGIPGIVTTVPTPVLVRFDGMVRVTLPALSILYWQTTAEPSVPPCEACSETVPSIV